MIKKLAKINNIFSYSFFEWDKINPDHGNNVNDPIDVFKKNNILFAENGNGKSRLVDLFKSINGQAIELKKNWDRSQSDNQDIKIILGNGSEIDFDGSIWSNTDLKNKFLVFDKYFIEEFVHSIGPNYFDTPQRRQQRGKNIIYLGNFASYNNEIDRINALKNYVSEQNTLVLEKEEEGINYLLNGQNTTLEELTNDRDAITKLNESDQKIKGEEVVKKQAEFEKIGKALKEKSKITDLSKILEIENRFSLEIEQEDGSKIALKPGDCFSFTVAKGVQETLHKIEHKKNFIREGLAKMTKESTNCPFCEQKIKNGDYLQIIKEYQEIFDEGFSQEEQNIKESLSTYKNILEELRDLQHPATSQVTLNLAKSFITIDDELPQVALDDADKLIIKSEIALILSKEKKILDKIDGSQVDKIKEIIKKTKESIDVYNKIVKKINSKIDQLKKDSAEGRLDVKSEEIRNDIIKLNKELLYIKNKKQFEKYFKILDQNRENEKVVEALERIYQSLKDKIIEEFNKFVEEYFDLIKGFVKELSPSMEILDITGQATIDRRNPRDSAQCGFRVDYNGKNCIDGLSEGERQVIALAFFFAQLKKEADKDKIIVLDDPITSFDARKRKSTAEVIQRETDAFEQLFVLTCDPLFREYCLKQINNRNFYYIFKTIGSSSIHYVPNNRETIYSSFETEFKNIDTINGSNENVIVYGQKLRFCLETKIKEDYFGYSEDNLSHMIKKVTGRNKEDFEKIFTNKEAILQIYSYCNTGGLAHYPKDGSTSWNELKDKIKQYLNLEL